MTRFGGQFYFRSAVPQAQSCHTVRRLIVEDICAMSQMRDEATDHNSVLTDYVDKMLMELEP
jgi:hypothetical protein